MKPVLIFQHAAHEGSGLFGEFLAEHDIPSRVVRAWLGETVPDDPLEGSGLVFMGGPLSVNDPQPFLQRELRLIARAAEIGTPLLGHCLGGQLISRALGGSVTRNQMAEIGWYPVWRIGRGPAAQHWLADTPERFDAFHWHGETFSLPTNAEWLWSSQACEHQAFAIGESILAMQCHLEMTHAMIETWTVIGAHELSCTDRAVQDADTILRGALDRLNPMQRVARMLYERWIARL